MRAPLSWLKAYVDLDIDPQELARRLTQAGLEVDSVTDTGAGWDSVVVGLVTAVEPHPNADRLRLVSVSTSQERLTSQGGDPGQGGSTNRGSSTGQGSDSGQGNDTVVCGAPNVAAGQRIAFARIGANLIDAHTGHPTKLKAAKIRGVESRGMVCSERELGLSDEHEGILVLPADAPLGTPLADYMADVIFELSITPNRPDCLSILGIAREAGAQVGTTAREPDLAYPEAGEAIETKTSVEVLDPDLCPRYIATVVTGVTVGPSPQWMQDRLAAAGVRSHNNVVDITNYVMLEYGQPLHAFDYDRLAERRIVVRRARPGERITTIDEAEHELTGDMLVIADAERAVALAGIMGGANSEVSDSTTNILLESAAFDQISIRKTSQQTGLRSEASTRFDKGLSRDLPLYAARRATQLLVEHAGGTAAKGIVDIYPGQAPRERLRLTEARCRRVLGVGVTAGEMAVLLGLLGFETESGGDGVLLVTAPYWRTDIAIEDDLIEEIVRVKGYDWIPTHTLSGGIPPFEPEPIASLKDQLTDALVGMGLQEIKSYPLTNSDMHAKVHVNGPAPLRVLNPMSTEMEELRLSLRGGLIRALEANQRVQESGVRLFEASRVYVPRQNDLPEEREMLAGILSGPRDDLHWRGETEDLDFFDAKGMLEALIQELGLVASYEPVEDPLLHPGRTASVLVEGNVVGILGELHPNARRQFDLLDRPVAYFELALAAIVPHLPKQAHLYRSISRFPSVVRDLALVLDQSVPTQRVEEIIQATPLVQRCELFDVYVGDRIDQGKKSLAYRVVYQAPNKTLTGEEATQAQGRLLDRLQKDLGATLRT